MVHSRGIRENIRKRRGWVGPRKSRFEVIVLLRDLRQRWLNKRQGLFHEVRASVSVHQNRPRLRRHLNSSFHISLIERDLGCMLPAFLRNPLKLILFKTALVHKRPHLLNFMIVFPCQGAEVLLRRIAHVLDDEARRGLLLIELESAGGRAEEELLVYLRDWVQRVPADGRPLLSSCHLQLVRVLQVPVDVDAAVHFI